MEQSKSSPDGNKGGEASRQPSPPVYNILVVDDDPDIRRLNVEILTGAGFQVETAADGAAAWQAVQDNQYDLMITDHKMPKMTGLQLIEKLLESSRKLPTIMVTAVPPGELSSAPALQQVDAMLLKPYAAAGLLAIVNNVLFANAPLRPASSFCPEGTVWHPPQPPAPL